MTIRGVLLPWSILAAGWLHTAWTAPVGAQGVLALQRPMPPNPACGTRPCQTSYLTWGFFHTSWRKWPEKVIAGEEPKVPSPFVVPERRVPNVELPDVREETTTGIRRRPDAAATAPGTGGSEPFDDSQPLPPTPPSPPSSSTSAQPEQQPPPAERDLPSTLPAGPLAEPGGTALPFPGTTDQPLAPGPATQPAPAAPSPQIPAIPGRALPAVPSTPATNDLEQLFPELDELPDVQHPPSLEEPLPDNLNGSTPDQLNPDSSRSIRPGGSSQVRSKTTTRSFDPDRSVVLASHASSLSGDRSHGAPGSTNPLRPAAPMAAAGAQRRVAVQAVRPATDQDGAQRNRWATPASYQRPAKKRDNPLRDPSN